MSAGWAKTSSIRPPVCVHQRMALAALHLLPGIIAAGTAALGGPDRLAVEDRGARACFAPPPLPVGRDQGVVDGLEQPAVAPSREPAIDRWPGRQVGGHQPPGD